MHFLADGFKLDGDAAFGQVACWRNEKFDGNSSGSIAMEAVIALGLLGLLFVPSLRLLQASQDAAVATARRSTARQFAESAVYGRMSEIINKKQNDFDVQVLAQPKTPCLESLSARVSWNQNARRLEYVQEEFQPDFSELVKLGRDCAAWGFLIKDDSPKITAALERGLEPSAIDILEINGQSFAFVGTISEEAEDLWIINLTDTPKLEASIELGPGLRDIDAVWVGDKPYVFAASYDFQNQLLVIDVSDPISPVTVSRQTLPGVGNSYPQGRSIFYYDEKIYIGVRETAGHELHMYDVSVPATSKHRQSREINHNVHSLWVHENKVYMATSADREEVIVLNENLEEQLRLNLGNVRQGEQDAVSISVLGKLLLVGRDKLKSREAAVALADAFTGKVLSEIPLQADEGSKVVALKFFGDYWYAAASLKASGRLYFGQVLDGRLEVLKQFDAVNALVDLDSSGTSLVAIDTAGQILIWE